MLSHFCCVWLFVTLWTIAHQSPLSMVFSKQGYWRGLPCPPPGRSSQPRGWTWASCTSCLAGILFTLSHLGSPLFEWMDYNCFIYLFQFSSVAQSCLTLCDPMDCSTPGFPVHHQLPELAQIHVHWVGDAIQLSHPLLSPSPPAFNLSQHQGLFQWVSSSHQVAKVLKLQFQLQYFQWIFRTDFLLDGLIWFPWSPRDSQESSSAPQFKSISCLELNFIYSPNLTSIHDY